MDSCLNREDTPISIYSVASRENTVNSTLFTEQQSIVSADATEEGSPKHGHSHKATTENALDPYCFIPDQWSREPDEAQRMEMGGLGGRREQYRGDAELETTPREKRARSKHGYEKVANIPSTRDDCHPGAVQGDRRPSVPESQVELLQSPRDTPRDLRKVRRSGTEHEHEPRDVVKKRLLFGLLALVAIIVVAAIVKTVVANHKPTKKMCIDKHSKDGLAAMNFDLVPCDQIGDHVGGENLRGSVPTFAETKKVHTFVYSGRIKD